MGSLITQGYVEQNKALHAQGKYGISGHMRAADVMRLAVQCDAKSILDYGCGQGTLKSHLTFPCREYDPAIEGKDHSPDPADLVVCTDVLEHIEPECLEGVLDHLKSLTRKICYAAVHLTAAMKTLADGRNAHLIVESAEWWREKLGQRFDVLHSSTCEREAVFVLGAKSGN